MGFRGRDPQLSVIIGWLDQLIGHQRTLDYGHSLSKLLWDRIATGLTERLKRSRSEETLDWFRFALRRWALTADNHLGSLLDARAQVEVMNEMAPCLAPRFEHAHLLMEGFILQGVHYTDCFDFDSATNLMKFVSESLKSLSNVYKNSFSASCVSVPIDLAGGVHFDLMAKALGTWVQSETLAGLDNRVRLEAARSLSDLAIREFSNTYDKLRQYQYRCHIEAADGKFVEARKFLARSLHPEGLIPDNISHTDLARRIRSFTESSSRQAFYLFHWLRLGAHICQSNDTLEKQEFMNALNNSELLKLSWCVGRECDYPAHGILRRLALIYASQGSAKEGLESLNRLHDLAPFSLDRLVLATISLAAQAEVSAFFWEKERHIARGLLDDLEKMLIAFQEKTKHVIPTLSASFEDWIPLVNRIIRGELHEPETVQRELLGLTRRVGY
jgi:tetratricopeptide (TPR) repeat protein